MIAIHEAMLEHGLESPYAERLDEWKPDPEWDARVTTRIPCGELLRRPRPGPPRARDADRPGRSVVPGARGRSRCPRGATEDYELVTSHVETSIPEDDLFAGITPDR